MFSNQGQNQLCKILKILDRGTRINEKFNFLWIVRVYGHMIKIFWVIVDTVCHKK
jgi:hypothetical protein